MAGLETVGVADQVERVLRRDATEPAPSVSRMSLTAAERWRGDAFIGDEVATHSATHDGATVVSTTRRGDSTTGAVRSTRSGVASVHHRSTTTSWPACRSRTYRHSSGSLAGRHGVEGQLMTPRGAKGPLPLIVCVPVAPRRTRARTRLGTERRCSPRRVTCLFPTPAAVLGRGHTFGGTMIDNSGRINFPSVIPASTRASPTASQPNHSHSHFYSYRRLSLPDRSRADGSMPTSRSIISNNISFHLDVPDILEYNMIVLEGASNSPAAVRRSTLPDARDTHTLYEPTWQIEWLSLSPDGRRAAVTEGYASDHGLLSGSVMMVNLVDGTTTIRGPDWRRSASPSGSTTVPSGTRVATDPARRAAGCGWTGGVRNAGAATRSSATR